MIFDPSLFGAAHVTLHEVQAEAEARALDQAKDIILPKLELATTDADGKRLNERNWRRTYRLVESL